MVKKGYNRRTYQRLVRASFGQEATFSVKYDKYRIHISQFYTSLNLVNIGVARRTRNNRL